MRKACCCEEEHDAGAPTTSWPHQNPSGPHKDATRIPARPHRNPTRTHHDAICHASDGHEGCGGIIGFLQHLWPGRKEGSKNLKHQKLFLTNNGVLNNLCNSYLGKLWHGNAHYPTCLVMQGRVVALNKNPQNHTFS